MDRRYRDRQWIEFREQILDIDGHKCVECGRGSPEVILQVHHKVYESNKAPWDYAPKDCETLCRGCHGRRHGEIMPDTGWTLYLEDDLGGLYGECELCGTEMRYAFYVQHALWEPMVVGTVCCDRLTGTKEATEIQKRMERKNRFIKSARWKQLAKGTHLKHGKDLIIEILPENGSYRIYMNYNKGKRNFATEKLAKSFVFDLILSGEAMKYANSHPIKVEKGSDPFNSVAPR